MKDFFLYETELQYGSGFDMFGLCHMMWLLGIVIFIWIGGNWYVRVSDEKKNRIKFAFSILFPLISIYRDIVLILTGHFGIDYLPLHLCEMALWLGAVYVWTNNRFIGVVYVLLCVPGAAGALLFPGWTSYPFFNYMHIHDFISHGLIVMFGIWLVRSGEVVPKWREFWMPMVFGLLGIAIIYPINNYLGTNYWFLDRPSYGSPFIYILSILGNKWYLAGYYVICIGIVAVWQFIINRCKYVI